jgi:hypothetical protein
VPRGPKGEKRPADVIGNAVKVMRIVTGEKGETLADEGGMPVHTPERRWALDETPGGILSI